MNEDYYKTLGISREATQAQIRSAYRNLAQKYHPDKNPSLENDDSKFKQISEAYAVLSNLRKKSTYDRLYNNRRSSSRSNTPDDQKSKSEYNKPRRTKTKLEEFYERVTEEHDKHSDKSCLFTILGWVFIVSWITFLALY